MYITVSNSLAHAQVFLGITCSSYVMCIHPATDGPIGGFGDFISLIQT